MTRFANMASVIRANREAGQFFFAPDSLAFWNSEIGNDLYHGHYFITSERANETDPKRYTVRFARSDGRIRELGDFMQHETEDAARAAIEDHYQSQNIHGNVPDKLFP